jgi:hypothetical protein
MTVPYVMTTGEIQQTHHDLLAAVRTHSSSNDPEIAETLEEFLTFFESALTKYDQTGKTDEQRWGEVEFPTPELLRHFETFVANAPLFQSAALSLADEANPDYRTKYMFCLEAYLELWETGF